MKSCGRRLKSTGNRCGTLFEGSGAYCRDCRNEYQKEYYARRKEPHYLPSTEKTGGNCQACATALRSNTVAIVDNPGLESTVVLCETCKAIVTYLTETVTEEAQEFLLDLINELAELRQPSLIAGSAPTYVPQLTLPPTSGSLSTSPATSPATTTTNGSPNTSNEMCASCGQRPAMMSSVYCYQCDKL